MSNLSFLDIAGLLWPDFSAILRGEAAGLVAVFVLFILVIAVPTVVYIFRRGREAHRALASLEEVIDQGQGHEPRTARSIWRAAAEKSEHINVTQAWREFDETLVETRDDVRNTIPANEYFNAGQLAPRLVQNRLLHTVPALLTGLGLLGTFIGLATGLNHLNLGSGTTVDELRLGIEQLVIGASLGFTSSVWGIFFSLAVNFYEKWRERGITRRANEASRRIDEIFTAQGPEQSLVKIEEHSSASTAALEELHEKIGTSLQEAVAGLSQEMQEALTASINTAMKPSMEAIARSSVEQSQVVFEKLVDKFATSFEAIGNRQAEELKAASEMLGNTMIGVYTTVSESVKKLQDATQAQVEATEKRAAAFQAQLDELTEFAAGLVQSMSDSSGRLEDAATKLESGSQHLGSVGEQLSSGAASLAETSTVFRDTLAESRQALETAVQSQSSAVEALERYEGQVSDLHQSTVQVSEKVSAAATALSSGFTQFEAQQEKFLRGLSKEYDEVTRTMSEYLSDYTNQVREQTADRMQEWNKHSQSYASNMLHISEGLNAALAELEVKLSAHHAQSTAS